MSDKLTAPMIQLVWLTLLAVHVGAAAVWWWLMPGGFVGPLLIVGVLLTGLFARGRLSEALLPPILAAITVFWLVCAVSARVTFGASIGSLWNVPFLAGAGLAGLWVKQFRFRVRPIWLLPLLVLPAAWAGWTFPATQRAPDPATTPLGGALGDAPAGSTDHKLIKLSKDAQLHPIDGRVVIRRDALVLNVLPMLSFADRSPDRFWASLAPVEQSRATVRSLVSKVRDGARWRLFYKDEDASVLEVQPGSDGVQLDARSRLAGPVFSHLNSFTELTLQGHHKVSVSFSPAPERRIEIPPASAPARFAFVDASGGFHVMQASQAKRSPFTELAAGRLGRAEPLVITIYDGDKPAFSVTFQDWAAQASTQPSPTAGEPIPVDAIELQRGSDAESAPALISLSLASTAIGRGTQTVGHAAGVYRNRVTVRLP
jgi:hypothetical protein